MRKIKKNPCANLKVKRPKNDLSDMFIKALTDATNKDEIGWNVLRSIYLHRQPIFAKDPRKK